MVGSATIKVRAKHRLCFLFHPHYHHLEQIMVIFKCKYVFLLLLRFRSKNQLFLALGLLMHVSKMPLMTRPNSLVSNKVGCQSSETKGRQRHSGPFLEHVCSPLTSKSDLLQIDNVLPKGFPTGITSLLPFFNLSTDCLKRLYELGVLNCLFCLYCDHRLKKLAKQSLKVISTVAILSHEKPCLL